MIKKGFILVLVVVMIFSSLSFANNDRVTSLGIIGQGGSNLGDKLSRDQLATVAVRLMGIEHLKSNYDKKGNFKDLSGWALPYVNMAFDHGVMSGVSKDQFNPTGEVTYVQVLTILMRLLGYKDGIDFSKYPDDYYAKALEIGLANMYLEHNKVISRGEAATTIEKAFDLKMKDSNISYFDSIGNTLKANQPVVVPNTSKEIIVKMENISFSTSIVGTFSGILKGADDFSGYKVEIYSKSGKLYNSVSPDKYGNFSISGFDNSVVAKLSGYEYKVYDFNGKLVLSNNLD